MAIRQILRYPNKKLEQIAEIVDVIDEDIVQLCMDLKETAQAQKAEGLAATQVGENKRIFVIKKSDEEDYIVCINPSWTANSDETSPMTEGCLSFPGVQVSLKRYKSIQASYQDEAGQSVTEHLIGLGSVAFQHELDHLNGVTFLYHMGKTQKRLVLKKLEKQKRRHKQFMKQLEKQLKNVKLEKNVVTDSTKEENNADTI